MAKMSELDADRQRIERLADVVQPPSFADSARAGVPAHTPTPWRYHSDCILSDTSRGEYQTTAVAYVGDELRHAGGLQYGQERDANANLIVKAVNNHDELVRRLSEATKAIEAGSVILAKLMDAESALNAVVAAKMPGEARRIAHEALQKIAG